MTLKDNWANDETVYPEDLNAISAAVNAIGDASSNVTTYLIDDFGADPTGATPSDAAIAAAISVLGDNPGILEFGPGIYQYSNDLVRGLPGQGIKGAGIGATILDYHGAGDAVRAWDSTVPTDGSTPPGKAGPITGISIWGWNNANANTNGLHIGDLDSIHLDVDIQGFNRSGCRGFWGENVYSWSERAWIQCSVEQCTDAYIFETNASHPGGRSSWDYSWYFLSLSVAANQNGVTFKNNVDAFGVMFSLVGNVAPGATNAGVVLTVGTTSDDNCRLHGLLQIGVETLGSSSAAHKDFNVAAASEIVANGVLEFNDFGSPGFAAGTASPSTVTFAGRVDCPSLGHSAGALTAYGPQFNVINALDGNAALGIAGVTDAVNSLTVGNAAAGVSPSLSAVGPTPDLHVVVVPQGDGELVVYEATGQAYAALAAAGSATHVGMKLITQGEATVETNAIAEGVNSTVSSLSAVGLTAASATNQITTGSSTQDYYLAQTRVVAGRKFCFTNLSSGAVTIHSNSGGTVQALTTGQSATVMANVAAPNAAGDWTVIAKNF